MSDSPIRSPGPSSSSAPSRRDRTDEPFLTHVVALANRDGFQKAVDYVKASAVEPRLRFKALVTLGEKAKGIASIRSSFVGIIKEVLAAQPAYGRAAALLAEILIQRGEHEEALAYLERANDLHEQPMLAEAIRVCRDALRSGAATARSDRARIQEDDLVLFRARQQTPQRKLVFVVQDLASREGLAAAVTHARQAKVDGKQRSEALAWCASRIQGSSHPSLSSEQLYKEALEANPRSVSVRIAQADILLANGQWDEALAVLEKAESHGDSYGVAIRQVRCHLGLRNLEMARGCFGRAERMARSTDSAELLHYRGRLDNAARAKAHITPEAKAPVAPSSGRSLEGALTKAIHAGLWEEAEGHLLSALGSHPGHPTILAAICHFKALRGHRGRAEQDLRKLAPALASAPGETADLAQITRVVIALLERNPTETQHQSAPLRKRKTPVALLARAAAAFQHGEHDNARELLTEILGQRANEATEAAEQLLAKVVEPQGEFPWSEVAETLGAAGARRWLNALSANQVL